MSVWGREGASTTQLKVVLYGGVASVVDVTAIERYSLASSREQQRPGVLRRSRFARSSLRREIGQNDSQSCMQAFSSPGVEVQTLSRAVDSA